MANRVKRTVYVGGLAEEVTERVLYSAFITFGEIVEVQIPRDPATLKTRGFGFVEFEDSADAGDAIENMDESEFYGRVLTVNYAKPLQNKLGTTRPVWDDIDEYNKLKEDITTGEVPKATIPTPRAPPVILDEPEDGPDEPAPIDD